MGPHPSLRIYMQLMVNGEGGRFSSTVTSVNLCSCKLPFTHDPISSRNETSWVMRGRRTSERVRRRKRRKRMRRKRKRGREKETGN